MPPMSQMVWFACPLLALVNAGSTQQAPSAAAPVSPPDNPRVEISVAYEWRRDRYRYRFDNDSSFDTPFLVPHFFTQSYVGGDRWLDVQAHYSIAGQEFRSEASFAAPQTTFGDDFDTFFQTDGDIVTSGTAGNVRLKSWAFTQTMQHSVGPQDNTASHLWLTVGYRFRRDRADFLPADRIVRHTTPPAESRTPISTDETTRSHVHAVLFGAGFSHRLGTQWRIELAGEASPTTRARLSTRLPDKYPGRDIVFTALAFSASGQLSLKRIWSRWLVEVTASTNQSWSYVASRQFRRDSTGVRVSVGVRP